MVYTLKMEEWMDWQINGRQFIYFFHLYQLILKSSIEQPATASEDAVMSGKNHYKNITAYMCIS